MKKVSRYIAIAAMSSIVMTPAIAQAANDNSSQSDIPKHCLVEAGLVEATSTNSSTNSSNKDSGSHGDSDSRNSSSSTSQSPSKTTVTETTTKTETTTTSSDKGDSAPTTTPSDNGGSTAPDSGDTGDTGGSDGSDDTVDTNSTDTEAKPDSGVDDTGGSGSTDTETKPDSGGSGSDSTDSTQPDDTGGSDSGNDDTGDSGEGDDSATPGMTGAAGVQPAPHASTTDAHRSVDTAVANSGAAKVSPPSDVTTNPSGDKVTTSKSAVDKENTTKLDLSPECAPYEDAILAIKDKGHSSSSSSSSSTGSSGESVNLRGGGTSEGKTVHDVDVASGPTVNTGGSIKESWFDKIVDWLTK